MNKQLDGQSFGTCLTSTGLASEILPGLSRPPDSQKFPHCKDTSAKTTPEPSPGEKGDCHQPRIRLKIAPEPTIVALKRRLEGDTIRHNGGRTYQIQAPEPQVVGQTGAAARPCHAACRARARSHDLRKGKGDAEISRQADWPREEGQ